MQKNAGSLATIEKNGIGSESVKFVILLQYSNPYRHNVFLHQFVCYSGAYLYVRAKNLRHLVTS